MQQKFLVTKTRVALMMKVSVVAPGNGQPITY